MGKNLPIFEKTAEKNIEKSKNMRIISEPTKDKQACFQNIKIASIGMSRKTNIFFLEKTSDEC